MTQEEHNQFEKECNKNFGCGFAVAAFLTLLGIVTYNLNNHNFKVGSVLSVSRTKDQTTVSAEIKGQNTALTLRPDDDKIDVGDDIVIRSYK